MIVNNKRSNDLEDLEGIIKKRVRLLIPYSEKDIPPISEEKIMKMEGCIISEQDTEQMTLFEADEKNRINKIIYFGYNKLIIPTVSEIKELIRETSIKTIEENELEELTRKYYTKSFKITIDYFGGTPNIEPFFNSALTYNQLENLLEPKKGDKGNERIKEARFLMDLLEETKELLEQEALITVLKDDQGEKVLYIGLENPYLFSIDMARDQKLMIPYKDEMSAERKIELVGKKEYLEIIVDLEIDNRIRAGDKVICNIGDLKGKKMIENEEYIDTEDANYGFPLTELLISYYDKPAETILQAYINYLKKEIMEQKAPIMKASRFIEEGLRETEHTRRIKALVLLNGRKEAFETMMGLKRIVDNYEERKRIEEKTTGQ